MNNHPILLTSLVALSALAACGTPPASNARLEEARRDYGAAQANPQTTELAGGEMKQAGDAMAVANRSWSDKASTAEIDHLAYMARQRVAIAQETARQRAAELTVTKAGTARQTVRLAARTDEADAARRSAESAQRQSEMSQRQTADAQAQTRRLEDQLADMNAHKTDRGIVITVGDVLFDTNRSELRAGGMRDVDKLVGFLKAYPQRTALVEGYTDSTGSEAGNQALSSRRASAVRTALVDRGIQEDRISARGYGQDYPVAGNDSSDGRQLNRRVEIVLSDERGVIVPR